MTNSNTPNTIKFAASIGMSRWYGFSTIEAAQAWMAANANGQEGTIVPACLAENIKAVG